MAQIANEVRRGNWVDYHGSQLQVTGISDAYIVFEETYYDVVNPDDVKGIELTPEWLDRFGFTKHLDQPDDEVFYNLHEILNLEQINENVYAFDYGGTVQTALISKVHQLQNLIFALTGRELELKK